MTAFPDPTVFRTWFDEKMLIWMGAARDIIGKGAEQTPLMLVYSDTDQCKVLSLPNGAFASGQSKNRLADLHEIIASAPEIRAVVTVIETWTLLAETKDEHAQLDSIADHPDREEALMFNAISHGEQIVAMAKIKRPDNTVADPVVLTGIGGRMAVTPPAKH